MAQLVARMHGVHEVVSSSLATPTTIMATIKIILTTLHIIGVALGVGGATFAEIFFLKSMRDGKIDPIEGSFMKVTYRILRLGLLLLVISGFGFLVWYRLTDQIPLLYQTKVWAKLTIIIILCLAVIGWEMRKVPLWLGSAISLTSWYAALIIGAWRGLDAPYLVIMAVYLLALVIVAGMLKLIRKSLGIPL